MSDMRMAGRGPNYFETDIEVGSNRQAGRVVRMVMGSLTSMVITMAVVLQVWTAICMHMHTSALQLL